jgi:hypothetical protein
LRCSCRGALPLLSDPLTTWPSSSRCHTSSYRACRPPCERHLGMAILGLPILPLQSCAFMSNIHTHLSTPRRVPQFSGRPLLSRPFAIRWRDIFKRLTRRSRLSRRHSSRYRCPTPRFTHTTSLFWASIGPFAFPWRETACGGRHRRGIAPRHTTTPHHHAWRVTWLNQRRCSPDDLRPGQAGRSMARMATVLALLACVLLCQVRAKEGGTGH